MKWVYEAAPEHGAVARAVALCLAWHHTEDEGAFPERATIVSETRLSDGAVGKGLRQLQDEGTVEKAGARPGGGTIVWRFPALDGPAPHAGPPESEKAPPVQHDMPDRPVQHQVLVQHDALGGPAPGAADRSGKPTTAEGRNGRSGSALNGAGRTDVAGEPDERMFGRLF